MDSLERNREQLRGSYQFDRVGSNTNHMTVIRTDYIPVGVDIPFVSRYLGGIKNEGSFCDIVSRDLLGGPSGSAGML